MKSLVTVATMITLAAGGSTMAETEPRIQDDFHATSVVPCFESIVPLETAIAEYTDQQSLFNAIGYITLIDEEQREVDKGAVISFYVDQDTGDFTILQTFTDGVSCILMEGTRFEPYVN